MNIVPFLLSLLIAITPSSTFDCDGEILNATIRNNLNGNFLLVTDLETVDQGAFAVLAWKDISLMLPVSFQKGEISFTDRKWLWSYQDNVKGLHVAKNCCRYYLITRCLRKVETGQLPMRTSIED